MQQLPKKDIGFWNFWMDDWNILMTVMTCDCSKIGNQILSQTSFYPERTCGFSQSGSSRKIFGFHSVVWFVYIVRSLVIVVVLLETWTSLISWIWHPFILFIWYQLIHIVWNFHFESLRHSDIVARLRSEIWNAYI